MGKWLGTVVVVLYIGVRAASHGLLAPLPQQGTCRVAEQQLVNHTISCELCMCTAELMFKKTFLNRSGDATILLSVKIGSNCGISETTWWQLLIKAGTSLFLIFQTEEC